MIPVIEFGFSLIVAHLVGDFVLQTERIVQNKRRWTVLLWHSFHHAALAYFFAGRWGAWLLPVAVLATHAMIDRIKIAIRSSRFLLWFSLDQAAHLLVIFLLTVWIGEGGETSAWSGWLGSALPRIWIVVGGAIVCVRVTGLLVGHWVHPYLRELEAARGVLATEPLARGLTNGGRVIGQWERALIYLFILLGQPAGVGFLVAAKSVFRFGELKDRENRMEAEYITIGTLMSFACALAVSYLVAWAQAGL